MKKIFILIFAVSLLSSNSSFARAIVKKTPKKLEVPQTSVPAPMHSIDTEVTVRKNGPEFSASAGLGTIGSKFHVGFGGQVEIPYRLADTPFKFGVQTGFYMGPSSPSTWMIPILFTGSYAIPTMNDLKPYIGLALGFSIFHTSGTFNVGPITVNGSSASSTDFALMIKPGANFGAGHHWFAEIPFGTLGSSFALLPSVGYHFH